MWGKINGLQFKSEILFYFFLSCLCFNTLFRLRFNWFYPFFPLLSAPAGVSTISPLSFLTLTTSFHRRKGILGKEHLSFTLICCASLLLAQVPPSCHISFCLYWTRIVLQQPLHKWDDEKKTPLSLSLSHLSLHFSISLSLFCCKLYMVTWALIFKI